MNILTDEEIKATLDKVSCCLEDRDIAYSRAIETKVVKTLRRQVIEEICFKMAAGSPNRERIHKLIDGWVL